MFVGDGTENDCYSREHLRHSLELATKAQDNHLRAVVLALVAAHYFHTAGDHAFQMLQACEQLAAGLGAPPTKNSSNDAVTGNAQLGLWVGQKFIGRLLCLHRHDMRVLRRFYLYHRAVQTSWQR